MQRRKSTRQNNRSQSRAGAKNTSPSPAKRLTRQAKKTSVSPIGKSAKTKSRAKVEAKSESSDDEIAVPKMQGQIEQDSQSEEEKITYNKGDMLAFVVPAGRGSSDTFGEIKLAYLLKKVMSTDKELSCDVFGALASDPLTFYVQSKNQIVNENTIIMDVKVQVLKGVKKPLSVKITKQVSNKIKKLVPAIIGKLEAEQESEQEEESSEKSETESDKSKEVMTQDIPQNRKILKVRGVKAQPSSATQITKRAARSTSRAAVKKDEDMKDEKKPSKARQIGKKRRKGGSDMDEDEDFEEAEEIAPVKKMKGPDGSVKQIKPQRPKRVPPKPKVLKIGKWNPDVELVDYEEVKESESNEFIFNCCTRCNNKNAVRAAYTSNATLLKKCIYDKKHITNVGVSWSEEVQDDVLTILQKNKDYKLLEMLLKPNVKPQHGENFFQAMNRLYQQRSADDQYLLNIVNTGRVSRMAYGTNIRAVEMTRGNRQGNNAFKSIERVQHINATPIISVADVETLKVLQKLSPHTMNIAQNMVYQIEQIMQYGAYKLLEYIVKELYKQTQYGFNDLHYNVLRDYKKGQKLEEFKSVSVLKKGTQFGNITPLHFACINPNVEVLKQLLEVNSDFNVTDSRMRRPIHYAAACESLEPLKYLLEKGANLADIDSQKFTALHFAAMAGRDENIRFILSKNEGLIKLRTRQGMTAMAYACERSCMKSVQALLENGAKPSQGVGQQRMTPLHWAAAKGNYELCEWLLDNKARVLSKDKFKRTPLIMAVRNGHSKVASLLLQRGADWNQTDSSSNTPLHFAAAYGWQECIDLLIKVGAEVNAENSWKVTPINIAMMKNHQGCVKKFLGYEGIDVNCKDESGRTLLTMALLDLNDRSVEFVKYLLEKGADPNLADVEGQTSMHYLAKLNPVKIFNWQENNALTAQDKKKINEASVQNLLKLAELLISKGASLKVLDNEKRTPFALCLELDHIDLLEKLLDDISINDDPHILHHLTSRILNERYQKILQRVLSNDKPTKETLEVLNDTGLTPFLAYIEKFTTAYSIVRGNLFNLVIRESNKHKDKVEKYEIVQTDLFSHINPEPVHNVYGGFNAGFGGRARFGGSAQKQRNDTYVSDNAVPIEKRQKITDELMKKLIVEPFIEILTFLLSQGADQHARVQKLKRFRDLEAERAKIALAKERGEEIQIQEEAKRREEVLKEREAEKRAAPQKKKAMKKGFKSQKQERKEAKKTVKMKEEEYHATMGLQNAFHLAVACPHSDLIDFLVRKNVNPDIEDHRKKNPFNLVSHSTAIDHVDHGNSGIVKRLMDLKVRIDLPDNKGRTAFLNFYSNNNHVMAYLMLDHGAQVNQIDASDLFALKYALIRRSGPEIEKLVNQYKANINLVDSKGRNLLHHAVNMSSASADATFETEQQLIDMGININLRDRHNRTPLHYAFVKIKNWNDITQIDPIETVSSLCGCKGLEIDVADKWLKTPLHYASQRGASICAMYLDKRGANKEAVDIYGNTPLGVAMLSQHHNYCIIMIQKNADSTKLVHKVDPEKIKKQWEEEEKAKNKDAQIIQQDDDEEMQDSEEEDKKKKHRNLFDRPPKPYDDYGDYDDEDDDESEDDSDDDFEQNAFNQNNAFNQKVFAKKAKVPKYAKIVFQQPSQSQAQEKSKKDEVEQIKLEQPQSMFRLAINHGQQGLAYLMIDAGYNLMLAMQDAMTEKKFQLVLTLLAKYPDDSIVQQKSSNGQTLFHVLSANCLGCRTEHLDRIYNTLIKRGLSCSEKDGFNRIPLHYAVISCHQDLVFKLLSDGNDVNAIDMYGYSPLVLYLKGQGIEKNIYNVFTGQYDLIFEALVKKGANINLVYEEKSYDKDGYKTTLLLHLLKKQAHVFGSNVLSNLVGFLQNDATLSLQDSEGKDPMIMAIQANNQNLVAKLIENKQRGLNLGVSDVEGKSAVHFVVNPCRFGSYENVHILLELHNAGYPLDMVDDAGLEPIHYAMHQQSGKLLNEIAKKTNRQDLIAKFNGSKSKQKTFSWPDCKIDYEKDAQDLLKLAEEKEDQIAQKQKNLVPVDPTGRFPKSYEVFCEDKKPWDAYMTKVDLRNGIYGDYVFYKMQLLYDKIRDLYVVFTRYGRIGEDGMNQRTPFNSIDEAKKEFCTIFKQKSANDFNDRENFSRVKGKYNLAKVNYVTVEHKDYLAPFNYEKCPSSKVEKNVRELLEEIANITMYTKALRQMGFDTETTPLSNLSKDSIQQAKDILKELSEALKENTELSKKGLAVDLDALTAVREKMIELSNRYYELIPNSRYTNQIAPPLNSEAQVKQQYDSLEQISNIEKASKILLGALHKQKDINPVDYVHEALNVKIENIDSKEPEFEALETYIKRSSEGMVNFNTHELKIFKIERKGEAERIDAYKNIGNHRLLFHGSSVFNFIGILSQGLKIAPPEAPMTGYMFGKGIYLADMFQKSYAYSMNHTTVGGSNLLLICEAALGNMKKLYEATPVEKLESPYNSVQGKGQRGPDYSQSLILPDGTELPSGPLINYVDGDPTKKSAFNATGFSLGHNEFIVYNTDQVKMRYLVQITKKDKK